MKVLAKGHASCLSAGFRYTPAASTDIAKTFARIRRELRHREADAKAIVEEQQRVVAPLPKRRATA